MSWLPARLPARVDAGGLTFVPLTPQLLDADYAAVMRDVSMLRAWSSSDWPTDGFSREDDLVDLERHDREQREGVALTYSVFLTADLVGCIYVRPIVDALFTRDVAVDPMSLPVGDVVVRGWALEVNSKHLIEASWTFLSSAPFSFSRLWWQTNRDCPEQLNACDALELSERMVFVTPSTTWVLASRSCAL
jgi:hypothetical protein